MRNLCFPVFALLILVFQACNDGDGIDVEIPNFNFPQTVEFADSLSHYDLFQGKTADLNPRSNVHFLELTSVLFTDYAYKQRLVKLPEGSQMDRLLEDEIDFPDGSILAKTFYYYNDERDTSFGKRIIETRLLIKANNIWNAATYIWNESQTDAHLNQDGSETEVSWTDKNGVLRTINYDVPNLNECIACHQSQGSMIPLGVKLRNLNRIVLRNGNTVNQLEFLQEEGLLVTFPASQIPSIVDYKNTDLSIDTRSRAYLEMNCAHCHNPNAWEAPAEQGLDFRYETPFGGTGILDESDEMLELIQEGEMPFIGTTILDDEGVGLLVAYLEGL